MNQLFRNKDLDKCIDQEGVPTITVHIYEVTVKGSFPF